MASCCGFQVSHDSFCKLRYWISGIFWLQIFKFWSGFGACSNPKTQISVFELFSRYCIQGLLSETYSADRVLFVGFFFESCFFFFIHTPSNLSVFCLFPFCFFLGVSHDEIFVCVSFLEEYYIIVIFTSYKRLNFPFSFFKFDHDFLNYGPSKSKICRKGYICLF